MNVWEPLFVNSSSDRFCIKINEIAKVLFKGDFEKNTDVGLHSGKTGIALFLFYYSRCFNEPKFAQKAFDILENVIHEQNDREEYSLCVGLSGVSWGLNHLKEADFLDSASASIPKEIETYLFKKMMLLIKGGRYDFLHDALGIAVFFISRPSNETYRKYLHQFVDELDRQSIKLDSNNIVWKGLLNSEIKSLGINFGLAHGMPSIITFLHKTLKNGINENKSASLMRGAITFIRKNSLDASVSNSIFPNWILEGQNPTESRLAWCYGDLGIANTFWLASQTLNDKNLETSAIEIFNKTTERNNLSSARIFDAGICHGSVGLAHIYNRMYNRTQLEAYKNAAIHWYNISLNMATFPDGLAGFKTRYSSEWVLNYNLLEGITGIGLSYLSTISRIEPKWDECLLIS